jgi:hypothetical protein
MSFVFIPDGIIFENCSNMPTPSHFATRAGPFLGKQASMERSIVHSHIYGTD